MQRFMIVVFYLVVGAGAVLAQTTDLILTEYVEGSGNNKAVEVFNGTEDVINLSGYTIDRYSNGALVAVSIALDAVDLDPGSAYVIANPLADAALLAYVDQTDGNINFNGNDALVLAFGGVIVDSFGMVGDNPVTAWSCDDGTTANHTLRRLSSICQGDAIADDTFDPCDQWSFAPIDVFSGLGDHIADCGAVADGLTGWGSLKLQYR